MSIRRALILSVSGRYVAVFIQLVASLVVARLLSPTDFGLFAIAAAVIAVSSSLREFGVTNYLIQIPELDRLALGRAVAFTMSASLATGIPLFLFRNTIAAFFGDDGIGDLIAILSLNFILVPFTIGPVSKLSRQYHHGSLQVINITSIAVAAVLTIVLAASGFGPSALAIGQIVQVLVQIAAYLIIEPRTLLCPPVFRGLLPMFRFGSFSALAYVANQFGNYGTSLILGRTLGPASVGLFERGNGLIQTLYNDLLGSVAMVVNVGLAKARGDREALTALLLLSLSNLTAALWPALVLLAVLADPVITVLFGEQWRPAVPVLQVLCASAFVTTAHALFGRVLLVMERTDRIFAIECAGQMVRLSMVLVLVGSGLTAAACGAVIASAGLLVLYAYGVRRYVRIPRREILKVYLRSFAIAVVTALLPALLMIFNPLDLPPFAILFLGGALGGLAWLAALFAIGHSMAAEVANILRRIMALPLFVPRRR